MRTFLFCLFFVLAYQSIAQHNAAQFEFRFTFEEKPLELSEYHTFNGGKDSIQFTSLKLYIGQISLINEETTSVYSTPHLLDLSAPESLTFNIDSQARFNAIEIQLGVDSLTNVSGAMGGDLDPLLGMYWTWQSGYINLKIEGNSNLCSSNNQTFQFHIGGYQFPNNALQKVRFEKISTADVILALPLDKVLQNFDLQNTNSVMSPSKKAVEFSAIAASHVKLVQ